MTTPYWIHKIEIGYLTDSGQELTLHADLERELHEQVVAAMGHEDAKNVRLTVYARRSPDSELRPMLLQGNRIVRVEPIPDPVTPADIRHRVQLTTSRLSSGVGIALSVWSGQGDWATHPAAGRQKAGRRALADLDQVLTELTAAREALATALDTEE